MEEGEVGDRASEGSINLTVLLHKGGMVQGGRWEKESQSHKFQS